MCCPHSPATGKLNLQCKLWTTFLNPKHSAMNCTTKPQLCWKGKISDTWRSLTRCIAPSPCPAIYKPHSWEIPIKQTLGFDAQVEQCHISAAFSMLPVNPVQKVGLRKRSSQHDSQSEPLEKQVKARRANSAMKQEKDSWHGISSRVTNFLPNHSLTPWLSGEISQ